MNYDISTNPRVPVWQCFTPKAFYLSLCMPVEPRVYSERESYEALVYFGAIDPIPEYEQSEAA